MPKDVVDMFNEEDYSRVTWDKDDMLVPTDDIVDREELSDWEEYEIPDERYDYDN